MGGDCRRGCAVDAGAVSAGQGERSESGALLHRHCADCGDCDGLHGLQEGRREGIILFVKEIAFLPVRFGSFCFSLLI